MASSSRDAFVGKNFGKEGRYRIEHCWEREAWAQYTWRSTHDCRALSPSKSCMGTSVASPNSVCASCKRPKSQPHCPTPASSVSTIMTMPAMASSTSSWSSSPAKI